MPYLLWGEDRRSQKDCGPHISYFVRHLITDFIFRLKVGLESEIKKLKETVTRLEKERGPGAGAVGSLGTSFRSPGAGVGGTGGPGSRSPGGAGASAAEVQRLTQERDKLQREKDNVTADLKKVRQPYKKWNMLRGYG